MDEPDLAVLVGARDEAAGDIPDDLARREFRSKSVDGGSHFVGTDSADVEDGRRDRPHILGTRDGTVVSRE
ncbi:MAG: hypothetical protein FGM58_04860 [Acidimicrobiia bacterium]|nr:hypothetical protein [Acidimicrobiia bacterium]